MDKVDKLHDCRFYDFAITGGFLSIDLFCWPIPSSAIKALIIVTFFWEIGFLSQFFTGLKGFLLTSLSYFLDSWIQFQIASMLLEYGVVLAFGAIAKKFLFLTLQGVDFFS